MMGDTSDPGAPTCTDPEAPARGVTDKIQFITCCKSTVGVSNGVCGAASRGVLERVARVLTWGGSIPNPAALGEMSSCTCFNNSISAAVSDADVGKPSNDGGAPRTEPKPTLLGIPPPLVLVPWLGKPPLLPLLLFVLPGILTDSLGRQLPLPPEVPPPEVCVPVAVPAAFPPPPLLGVLAPAAAPARRR